LLFNSYNIQSVNTALHNPEATKTLVIVIAQILSRVESFPQRFAQKCGWIFDYKEVRYKSEIMGVLVALQKQAIYSTK